MNKLKGINYKFFIVSLFIDLLIVPFHELVHAIVYKMQGYEVIFHFTSAEPINGVNTIFGATVGLGANILFASIFALLFIECKNLYIYAMVVANTLMARIVAYIFALFGLRSLNDEIYIAKTFGVSPTMVYSIGLFVMCLIIGMSTRRLFIEYGKKYSLHIVALSAAACTVAFLIIKYIEISGI
ncbi:MAG: hypothetical protein WBI07_05025 [Mobilitalea sp.]